jgi:hypothetical protein
MNATESKTVGLEFRWTVSRGRDTYGYNICTLYADGDKVSRCNGGGYDMKGTCLGHFIASHYADRLNAIRLEDMPEHSHWQPDHKRICAGKCHEEWHDKLIEAISEDKEQPELPTLPDDCYECPTCGGDTKPSGGGQRIDDGRYFYGLTFHDPNYDASKAVIGEDCSDRTLSNEDQTGKTVEQAERAGVSFGLERIQAVYKASSKHPTERHTVPSIDGACGFESVVKIMEAIDLRLEWVKGRRNRRDDMYILHDDR